MRGEEVMGRKRVDGTDLRYCGRHSGKEPDAVNIWVGTRESVTTLHKGEWIPGGLRFGRSLSVSTLYHGRRTNFFLFCFSVRMLRPL